VVFGRLLGRLAVSRAFGDFEFKYINPNELGIKSPNGPLVLSQPDIYQIFIDPSQDEFLLLACDGLFEAYSPQEAVTAIREKLCRMPVTEQDPQRVIREVVNSAIYERRTRDNVTAILVTLSCGIQI